MWPAIIWTNDDLSLWGGMISHLPRTWLFYPRRICLLAHLPLMPHICVTESGQIMAPSHYLNQGLTIVNLTHRDKLQWTFNENFSFMKMHLKISSAKWRSFCPGEMGWYTDHTNYDSNIVQKILTTSNLIQSNAVITRSKITWYYLHRCTC